MQLAKVIGKIWSTTKADSLTGYKLLQVQVLNKEAKTLIAADSLDAGIGETVLITGGSSAKMGEMDRTVPIDATVIAIIDEKESSKK